MALSLFHEMAERVPAYKDFLKTNGVNPDSIQTVKDFKKVPTVDKDNYLRKYRREDLCWDGKFASERWVISTTSGSTGEPFYFPRTDLQDEYYALTAELYLRENFNIQDKTTLYIDAFAMGAWIGGLFTYEAVKRVADKGYAISIITPGINKAEVINSVKKLGPAFGQVIIGCYPPIMKDIIDLGNEQGLDWSDYNLGIVFSAEGFSEQFRDYAVRHGKLSDIYTSTLNHYGTVDLGTMSHETPTTILVRRQAVKDKQLYSEIFGKTHKQPTLTQYVPEMFYFEEDEGKVICTSQSGIPLVRYDLKDNGGIITLKELYKIYDKRGKNLDIELRKANIEGTKWNLPMVYLYERSDFSVTLVGGNIYPEEVRTALITSMVSDEITGKFTMEVQATRKMNSTLVVNVELRRGVDASKDTKKIIQKAIITHLLKENSEYKSNIATYGRKLWPKIVLWPYEDPKYFAGKGKQQWVKK